MKISKPVNRLVSFAAVTLATVMALSACTTASEGLGLSGQSDSTSGPEAAVVPAALDETAAALVPSDIKAKGTLVVGTDPTFPPYEFYGADNKSVTGWDADFAGAIGQTLGLKVVLEPSSFDAILPGLSSRKYDMGISAFSVTPERRKNADFAVYLNSGSGLAVPPGNPRNLTLDDPLTLCGTSVAGQKGTSQGIEILPQFSTDCVKSGKPEISIQLFPTQDQANLALMSGRVDSVMSDSVALGYQSKLVGGKFELAKGNEYDPTPTGVALPKDSQLTPAVTAAVKALVGSETYKSINSKYGVPDRATVTADLVDKVG